MNINRVVIPRGLTSWLQVLDVVNKPFQEYLKQLCREGHLTRDHALRPPDNQEAQGDSSLSVDHNGIAAQLTRSDCGGF